jgi:toxin ParE1/3/4
MKVRVSGKAKLDLFEIYSYLADLNESAAERLMSRVNEKLERLSRFPFIGRERPEFGPRLRSIVVADYVVFYSIEKEITVMPVIHGRMDLQRAYWE